MKKIKQSKKIMMEGNAVLDSVVRRQVTCEQRLEKRGNEP